MPIIAAALSLASTFAPKLIGLISGPKAETVAQTVVNTAQAITGTSTPEDAGAAMQKDPALALKFQQSADALAETIIHEQGNTMRAAINADKDNPQTTRPKIALLFAWVTAISVLLLLGAIAYAVATDRADMLDKVGNAWPLIAAALVPIVRCIQAYFGILRDEHANKLSAGNGQAPAAAMGAIASIVSAIKGNG